MNVSKVVLPGSVNQETFWAIELSFSPCLRSPRPLALAYTASDPGDLGDPET